MTLIDIKNYLTERREATLSEIAAYFSADQETARGMLELWQRKGRVNARQAAKCGGCNQCSGGTLEIWQWIG